MEKLERYLQFMREAERLKNVLRSARTSTGRHESTAEHTWRLALLALVLADEKPELDLPRVLAMCLVHDLGEAYEGDIPAVAQCDPASKAAAELAAMERLTPLLPAEAAARIRTLWEEPAPRPKPAGSRRSTRPRPSSSTIREPIPPISITNST